jgi:hypothetical protein
MRCLNSVEPALDHLPAVLHAESQVLQLVNYMSLLPLALLLEWRQCSSVIDVGVVVDVLRSAFLYTILSNLISSHLLGPAAGIDYLQLERCIEQRADLPLHFK